MGKFSLDSFARELAIEINLGGFRIDRSDVEAHLHGIPAADLERLRGRVVYHGLDFAPPLVYDGGEGSFSRWLPDEVDAWLSGVRTAEQLGEPAGKSWFAGETLYEDRDKFFISPSGIPRRCTKATRLVMWPDVRTDLSALVEIPVDAAARGLASWLVADAGGQHLFVSPVSTPGGELVALQDDGGGVVAVRIDGSTVPFEEVLAQCGAFSGGLALDALADALSAEVTERMCRNLNEASELSADREYFLKRAELLMRLYGKREKKDFLYDVVRVASAGGQAYELVRTVDEAAPEVTLDRYSLVRALPGEGGLSSVPVAELDSPSLRTVIDDMVNTFAEVLERGREDHGVEFSDGPVVRLYGQGDTTAMKVSKVDLRSDGAVIVSGKAVSFSGPSPVVLERELSVPLLSLSDSGVEAVRRASDSYVERYLKNVRTGKVILADKVRSAVSARSGQGKNDIHL